MKRLLHWGPLIALAIIKCISLTTLYFTGYWFTFHHNGWLALINYICYYCLLAVTLYNFLCAIIIGPDYVPKGWRPECGDDEQYLQYCYQCDGYKAPRSHHCSKCKRCILKMDHHCPWINNCCGYRNQKFFFNFLLAAVIGSMQSAILLSITLYRALTFIPNSSGQRYIHLTIWSAFLILISIGMAIGVVFAVGFLLYLQARIIIYNCTSIEDWIIKKLKIVNDPNRVWQNIRQVLWQPLSDGIRWPVRNGCNQYTLTYEQLQQKKDKIDNASLYRIIRPYNGRFFPLFSQGFKVCITFPINDDPRLVIESGDEILVTHSHKNWFYGQKLTKNEKIHPKGWFPCQCAVLMVRPTLMYYTNNNDSGDQNHHYSSGDDGRRGDDVNNFTISNGNDDSHSKKDK
ncbi:palmitoyltransferase zdhhc6-like protein [Dermatophagoides farinae]|uniref:Palmitoyltransferase n=1 Tax=Dermatophagoides farinae TaxID=6954 RepID=A0A9D4SDE6_DERFA|nr:palmitoyltransferase zdhhc6-like protein [Dermatophagoides farinae]